MPKRCSCVFPWCLPVTGWKPGFFCMKAAGNQQLDNEWHTASQTFRRQNMVCEHTESLQTVSSWKCEGYFLLGFQKILECKFIMRPEMEAGSELVDCASCFPALELLSIQETDRSGGRGCRVRNAGGLRLLKLSSHFCLQTWMFDSHITGQAAADRYRIAAEPLTSPHRTRFCGTAASWGHTDKHTVSYSTCVNTYKQRHVLIGPLVIFKIPLHFKALMSLWGLRLGFNN